MLKSPNAFVHQVIDKIKFLALLKPLLSSRMKASMKKIQIQHNAIIIQGHNKETMKNVEDINTNHTKHLDDSIAHFYQKKEDCNLILTNETKFMNPGFWNRVHEHIISSATLQDN